MSLPPTQDAPLTEEAIWDKVFIDILQQERSQMTSEELKALVDSACYLDQLRASRTPEQKRAWREELSEK